MEVEKCTAYNINDNSLHVDNLRDSVEDCYETSIMKTKIAETIKFLSPHLDLCIYRSLSNGPGISFFKFLRNKKMEDLKKKGIHTNCEYHYVSQTSIYYKHILDFITNKAEIDGYEWPHKLLIVMKIPSTSSVAPVKYNVYAKVVDIK